MTELHDALIIAEGQRDQARAERDALRQELDAILTKRSQTVSVGAILTEVDTLRAERDALRDQWSGLLIEQARLMAMRDDAIAERDKLRTVATGWCAECKGMGFITVHTKDSANSGNVTTRRCVCGGEPLFTTRGVQL